MGWRRFERSIRRIGRDIEKGVSNANDYYNEQIERYIEQVNEAFGHNADYRQRLGDDLSDALGGDDYIEFRDEWLSELYDLIGIEHIDGQIRFTNDDIRMPRWASWDDVMDPYLRGAHPSYEAFYPDKSGFSIPLGYEFRSADGSAPAQGIRFIGHAPRCVFQSLTITQSGIPLSTTLSTGPFWSARLVQRDSNGFPIFISGPVTRESDDGLQYREDLRMLFGTAYRSVIRVGGAITPGLPMFLALATSEDFSSNLIVGLTRVQVTANVLVEDVL